MRTGRGGGALSPIKIIMGTRIPQTRLEPELAIDSFGSQEKKIWQKKVRGEKRKKKRSLTRYLLILRAQLPTALMVPQNGGVRRENKRKSKHFLFMKRGRDRAERREKGKSIQVDPH